VKLNQKVMVTVSDVDVPRKRISLTMKDQQKGSSGGGEKRSGSGNTDRKPTGGGGGKSQPKKPEPLNPFQAKLAELKKKFND
jgi:uncharacterized protein